MNKPNGTARPVTRHENREAKGGALACDRVWKGHVEEVEELRRRQADYLATLPTEPHQAMEAIRKSMHPSGQSYPEGVERAYYFSLAIQALTKSEFLSEGGPESDAIYYLADVMEDDLRNVMGDLDHISAILAKARDHKETPTEVSHQR
ncbi:MAG: hypothetical protein ACU0GG_21675 [Paracoccaceae bacterium]